MDKDIIEQLYILVIIPVLSAAAAFVIAWLRAKTKEISKKTEKDLVIYNLQILDKTIEEVVNTMNKTTIGKLIEKRDNGMLPDEDIEKLKLETLNNIYTVLEESQIVILKKATSDLDCLICSKIESILYGVKADEQKKS